MLKTLRTQKALSQRDLARISGVSTTTINRIETGKIDEVKPSTKRKLAAALGVDVTTIKWNTD